MEYKQKLLDPKWQKKRLQVLERDNWSCVICGDGESTLNVHHKFYTYNIEPWDYPMGNYITLCPKCHDEEHAYKDQFGGIVNDLLLMGHTYKSLCGFLDDNTEVLLNGI